MSDNSTTTNQSDFEALLDSNDFKIPKTGEIIKGTVIFVSKSEVKLDINGFLVGIIRGNELYNEDDEYGKLKIDD